MQTGLNLLNIFWPIMIHWDERLPGINNYNSWQNYKYIRQQRLATMEHDWPEEIYKIS